MIEAVHIVFDGPPSHEGPRFIEVERPSGRSVNVGEWRERPDGYWELVLPAPTTRETADHAELARLCEQANSASTIWHADKALTAIFAIASPDYLLAILSEIAALRGEVDDYRLRAAELTGERDALKANLDAAREDDLRHLQQATQAERQRDELRKAADTAASLFKLCTEPTMFENASTLNVYAQMTEWLVRNRPLIANQGADQ